MSGAVKALNNERKIIAGRGDGLGGRLFNLLWAWRMGRKVGSPTVIFWPGPPGEMTEHFGHDFRACNIFDIYLIERRADELGIRILDAQLPVEYGIDRIDYRPKWRKSARSGWTEESFFGGSREVLYTHYDPIKLRGEAEDSCDDDLRSLFKSIPLEPGLESAVRNLNDQVDLASAVGVHYRRGDIAGKLRSYGEKAIRRKRLSTKLLAWTNFYLRKCAPAEAYVDYLNTKFGEDCKILLLSDDNDAFEIFSSLVSVDRLTRIDSFTTGFLPIKTAMFEMLAMSSTKEILSTNSGFSSIASLIGEVPTHMVKFHMKAKDFWRDYGQITGFGMPGVSRDLLQEVAEMILSSDRYGVVAGELGWNLSSEELISSICGYSESLHERIEGS